jgi:hypothetical protein
MDPGVLILLAQTNAQTELSDRRLVVAVGLPQWTEPPV